jgi:uncharacterized protein YjbI with pentapeptide repeats
MLIRVPKIVGCLKGQEAFDLYSKGREAWNDWASANPGFMVDFSDWDFSDKAMVDFSQFLFPGEVSFHCANFGDGTVNFHEAEFRSPMPIFGRVDFSSADFGRSLVRFSETMFSSGSVSFDKANFESALADFTGVDFGKCSVLFNGVEFGQHVSFVKAKFGEGPIGFSDVIFRKSGSFRDAVFPNEFVSFSDAKFSQGMSFDRVTFSCPVYLNKIIVGSEDNPTATLSFNNSNFNSSLNLDESEFTYVPDFRHSHVTQEVSMINMKVNYRSVRKELLFFPSAGVSDSSKYRKLRVLARDANDHDREIEFFSYEQRAKFLNLFNFFQYIPIWLYAIVSDFGRSFSRPLVGFLSTWLLCAILLYWEALSAAQVFYYKSIADVEGDFWNALWLTASNLLPFSGWSSVMRDHHLKVLFSDSHNSSAQNVSSLVEVISYTGGLLSLVFMFLMGLAIRNKLRL